MRAYERLIRYAAYPTASDENCPNCPSTPAQMDFARVLVEEMKSLGIHDANVDENGYVFGTIPANIPEWSGITIGFIAHMDVVDEVPFENIRPRVIEHYDGDDIVLNDALDIVMSPSAYPSLKNKVGKTLVVTDGTTLLGADDKAGIAEILTMAEILKNDPSILHGDIKIGFTPDEEIGRGADLFDVARFGADFAYTADGGGFGEVEYETFNAASLRVTVHGLSTHPGGAKGVMKNASLIAMEYAALLPEDERPEKTEGYEGFFHLTGMRGQAETAELDYILRDHDAAILERRKDDARRAAEEINRRYGAGTVEITIRDSYRNMAEMVRPHWHLIETAYEAVRELGGTPTSVPVRGGTDGSRLSYMGLPCPNLSTGGYNGHGRMEYACAEEMDDCVQVLLKIAEKYAAMKK